MFEKVKEKRKVKERKMDSETCADAEYKELAEDQKDTLTFTLTKSFHDTECNTKS